VQSVPWHEIEDEANPGLHVTPNGQPVLKPSGHHIDCMRADVIVLDLRDAFSQVNMLCVIPCVLPVPLLNLQVSVGLHRIRLARHLPLTCKLSCM
jgi:hypothetical protein